MYQYDNNKIQQQNLVWRITKISEVNLSAFIYRLFHEDKLTSEIFVILHSILNFAAGFYCCHIDTSTLHE